MAGDKVTGKASFERMGEKGEADLLEGKLVGDKVSFVEMLDAMGNTVRIEYEGTVKGDEIAFTRKVGEFGTEQFVARRAEGLRALVAGARPRRPADLAAAGSSGRPARTKLLLNRTGHSEGPREDGSRGIRSLRAGGRDILPS